MGRFVIVCALVTGVLWFVFQHALTQADIQADLYERAEAERMAAAQPVSVDLDVLTVRPCAPGACLLVQGGGREFLVGASEGAAQGLFQVGGLSANLDGVLLTDLSRNQIEGLLGVRDRTLEAGRKSPLPVYGPSGVERVVDGVNAMLETSDAERALRYAEGLLPFSAAPVKTAQMGGFEDGAIVFDSGVLSIRIINVASDVGGGDALVYRFDLEGDVLVVGGCNARLDAVQDALAMSPAPDHLGLVLPVASEAMMAIKREQAVAAQLRRESRFVAARADDCLTINGYASLLETAAIDHALAWPLFPHAGTSLEERFWQKSLTEIVEDKRVAIGKIGEPFIVGKKANQQ